MTPSEVTKRLRATAQTYRDEQAATVVQRADQHAAEILRLCEASAAAGAFSREFPGPFLNLTVEDVFHACKHLGLPVKIVQYGSAGGAIRVNWAE